MWEKIVDEEFDERFLLNFCEQLATARNLFFNIDVSHLSCSIQILGIVSMLCTQALQLIIA
ncbi:hypothetical protein [Helicobacter cinaedi]|uniref:hypothetical protein n=1 Tax=Helicobacter cinaedi TaxID=213 RepID=UPI001E335684|nr:hypothetical protein [Helicobacter cinaedi]